MVVLYVVVGATAWTLGLAAVLVVYSGVVVFFAVAVVTLGTTVVVLTVVVVLGLVTVAAVVVLVLVLGLDVPKIDGCSLGLAEG